MPAAARLMAAGGSAEETGRFAPEALVNKGAIQAGGSRHRVPALQELRNRERVRGAGDPLGAAGTPRGLRWITGGWFRRLPCEPLRSRISTNDPAGVVKLLAVVTAPLGPVMRW